ncbi:TrkH family potassium uptake protein [Corallincola holothuriorum]|uniref:Trk system potassium uptake protein n=1 Tax=Corallincola holothuriorum TaxID=2282215 RepID=A0A368N4F8_9GAMM|nr:TrkH family potassium uptake protein [Corallincola holothuriorum]RCU45388.1 TrkH family potassium uptake protein [Corallincola holothuriorum]
MSTINYRLICLLIGLFLSKLTMLMVIPLGLSFIDHDGLTFHYVQSAGVTAISAIVLLALGRGTRRSLSQLTMRVRDMFMLTTLTWLVMTAFAALPLIFVPHTSYTDAFFETMSGVTTTGSTVMSGLDALPRSILIWRSLLQWLGGIGFIVMGVGILPFLNVGGMRLFQTESSDWSDKPVPQTRRYTQQLLWLYIGLTLLCSLCYWLTGMSLFEAVCHAMTTLSTGGFSTSDSSMAEFSSASHWVGSVFMLLGGLPFILFILMIRRRSLKIWRDEQVSGYLALIAVTTLILSVWMWQVEPVDYIDALRLTLFNIVSVITTTGFALGDYTQWGSLAVVMFFFLTFVGGCSGSTAGGLKIFRFQVAFKVIYQHMKRLVHPAGIFPRKYNDREISDEIITSMIVLMHLFFLTWVLLSLALAMLGIEPLTALTGALTALTNVGPGLGDQIGPSGNFADLPDTAKWLLSIAMLLGRLEITTAAVLLLPTFWRK